MSNNEDEKPRLHLKVVSCSSELPDKARCDAEQDRKLVITFAEFALAELAVTILRTLAGSNNCLLRDHSAHQRLCRRTQPHDRTRDVRLRRAKSATLGNSELVGKGRGSNQAGDDRRCPPDNRPRLPSVSRAYGARGAARFRRNAFNSADRRWCPSTEGSALLTPVASTTDFL